MNDTENICNLIVDDALRLNGFLKYDLKIEKNILRHMECFSKSAAFLWLRSHSCATYRRYPAIEQQIFFIWILLHLTETPEIFIFIHIRYWFHSKPLSGSSITICFCYHQQNIASRMLTTAHFFEIKMTSEHGNRPMFILNYLGKFIHNHHKIHVCMQVWLWR